jgi:hypothetical protein
MNVILYTGHKQSEKRSSGWMSVERPYTGGQGPILGSCPIEGGGGEEEEEPPLARKPYWCRLWYQCIKNSCSFISETLNSEELENLSDEDKDHASGNVVVVLV